MTTKEALDQWMAILGCGPRPSLFLGTTQAQSKVSAFQALSLGSASLAQALAMWSLGRESSSRLHCPVSKHYSNRTWYPITVTLNVDARLQTSEATLTTSTTVYSTQVSPYVTEQVTVSTRPVGFGLQFYAGIGPIAVAVIALAISRMRNAAPRTAPPSTSAPAIAQAGPVVSPAAATSVARNSSWSIVQAPSV